MTMMYTQSPPLRAVGDPVARLFADARDSLCDADGRLVRNRFINRWKAKRAGVDVVPSGSGLVVVPATDADTQAGEQSEGYAAGVAAGRLSIVRGLRKRVIFHMEQAVRLTGRGDVADGDRHEAWAEALDDASKRIDEGSWG